MMRYPLAISLALLLTGCSGQEQASQSPVETLPTADDASIRDEASRLPGGIEFTLPSQLRDDRTYQTKAGATRRKLTYELLEASPGQAKAAVTQVLADAGYRAGEPKEGKKGTYGIKYKKKKSPSITVTFFPGLAKEPANPDAKSMVALSWQTKAAPKPAD